MDELDVELVFLHPTRLTHDDYIHSLRNLDFRATKWMYVAGGSSDYPYQGDIIPSCELAFVADDGAPVVYHGSAMLLSHGCDAVEGEDIIATLAPVLVLTDLLAEESNDEARNVLDAKIKSNQMTNRLYLPASDNMPESCADFAAATCVTVARINERWRTAPWKERLTREGWLLMTGKLAYHFARLEKTADYVRGPAVT